MSAMRVTAALVALIALAYASPAPGQSLVSTAGASAPADRPQRGYADRLAAAEPTAESQFQLARWCRENDMPQRYRQHLQQALRCRPGYPPVMRELGFERVGELWLAPKPTPGPAPANERVEQIEADRRHRQKIGRLTSWLRNIYHSRLNVDSNELFADGARRIRAVRDPDAAGPLGSALGDGGPRVRRLLAEALGEIPGDEAAMQLLALGLLESDQQTASLAGLGLIHRDDPRIVEALLRAVRTGDEVMIRNAAGMLGQMQAREAVEPLAGALVADSVAGLTPRNAWRSTRLRYFRWLAGHFDVETPRLLQFGVVDRRIHAAAPAEPEGSGPDASGRRHRGRVMRTEVQEALYEITGENFGFDADAYVRWSRGTEGAEARHLPPLPRQP